MTIPETYRFYFILIIVSGILFFISEMNVLNKMKITVRNRKLYIIHPWSILFKFSALCVLGYPLAMRDCGADKQTYYYRYLHNGFEMMDGLFDLFRNFIHIFISDPRLGIGIIGVICLVIVMITISSCEREIEVYLSCFAFITALYFYYYNYVRMMTATTLVIVAFSYMIKNKNKQAIIFLIIASCIHLSAIAVLLVYITMQYFIKYRRFFIGLLIAGISAFVYNPMFFLMLVRVNRYSSQIVSDTVNEARIGLGTFLRALPILLVQIFYLKNFKQSKIYNKLLALTIINIGISMVGYFVGVASRLANMYFTAHILFAIPWIIKHLNSYRHKIYLRIFFIVYMLFYYYIVSQNFETMMIVPYHLKDISNIRGLQNETRD